MIKTSSTFLSYNNFSPQALAFLAIALILYKWKPWKNRIGSYHEIVYQRASVFSPDAVPDNKIDTIVIGTGPGACTTANLLAQSGKIVLMLEQHTKTGGGTHSFRLQGCEWDTGLHYTSKAMSQVTARPGAIMDFMSKGTQAFRQFPEPFDEIVFPDHFSYPYMNGRDKTIEAIMERIDSTDIHLKERVKTYMDIYTDIHQGFVALGLSRILPRWLHFLIRPRLERLKRYASLTVRDVQYAVLNLGYSKDLLLRSICPHAPHDLDPDECRRRLKTILAHPIGDYGTQPREASFAAHGVTAEHYIDGGSYTVGPTQSISIRLTSVVRACGGDVLVDATVREIIVENGRAVGVRVSKTSDLQMLGPQEAPVTEIRARSVVCGTTSYNLYNKLLPKSLPIVKQFQDPKERTMKPSNGHLFVFYKIKGDADELQLPDHNVWYFDGDDLDEAYDRYYANPYFHRPPVVYIGFPCTKDCTWKQRFPGMSNCIIISDCLYKWFEEWSNKPVHERGPKYDRLKESLTTKLIEIMYEFVPQLIGKVEYIHLATPLTEESYLGSYKGGAYDTLCTPDMFAEVNDKWRSPRTPIPGLYISGSSAFFPGLTGAMYGGCLCACTVLGYVGSFQLGVRLLSHLATRLRDDNPKLTRLEAWHRAIQTFFND